MLQFMLTENLACHNSHSLYYKRIRRRLRASAPPTANHFKPRKVLNYYAATFMSVFRTNTHTHTCCHDNILYNCIYAPKRRSTQNLHSTHYSTHLTVHKSVAHKYHARHMRSEAHVSNIF